MHAGALRALEFDRIVDAVRSFALTPLGAARLAELQPLTDPSRVEAALAATTEAVRYLADNPAFPLVAPAAFERALHALAIEGRALDPDQLLALAEALASVEATRQAIRRASGAPLPHLRALADAIRPFDHEVAIIRRTIEPSGFVVDQASPELRAIRDRLRRQRARLKTTLESFLRGRETSRFLQDQIVTDRDGRSVLVVRAEHRAAIPGIIHGSSASGASLFLEPLSTVELNNEVVALEEQEAAEVRRILLALGDLFRTRAADLQRTLDAMTELDVLHARACLSNAVDGVAPRVAADGRFELYAARHPLLIAAVAERAGGTFGTRPVGHASDPVAVDLLITPPARVLVVTGPNTGGKTVALKTAGLLALMAQAGLHVPAAAGSSLPVFRTLFADIGDEQSIAASLSTFSWHVSNIVAMDRGLALPALVLLDEIGAGTDPLEGGALGIAVLEHFRERGALVVATTHDEALKSYASTTSGVVVAAFGFDQETFAPTYRLIYGSAGRSLALEIARRLGLPAPLIERAREQRSAREAQLAAHLEKVDRQLRALEHEQRLVAAERQQLGEDRLRLRARDEQLKEREASLQRRAEDRVDAHAREARRAIDEVVEDLKRRAAALADVALQRSDGGGPGLSTGDIGAVRTDARAAVDIIANRWHGEAAAPEPPPVSLRVGDRVAIGRLGVEGIVRAIHGREAEVEARGKRLRVSLPEVRACDEPAAAAPAVTVRVHLQPGHEQSTDLNVIGCTVDEALSRAERFLDDALLNEQRTVRVIHGYGTGQLRRAIAGFLERHPQVATFGDAPPEQGGGGVTVIDLKE